jgi:hypothetical protein
LFTRSRKFVVRIFFQNSGGKFEKNLKKTGNFSLLCEKNIEQKKFPENVSGTFFRKRDLTPPIPPSLRTAATGRQFFGRGVP